MSEIFQEPTAVLTLSGRPQDLPLTPFAKRRVRLVEIRLDRLDPSHWSQRAKEAERAFPSARLIGTLRLEKDGGNWPDSQDRRGAIESALALRRWDYVDIEDDAPQREELLELVQTKSPATRIVLSRHSFEAVSGETMMDQLEAVARSAQACGAEVAKWAGRVLDPNEVGPELLRWLSLYGGPAIPAMFLMGVGAESWRVAAAKLSGGWGYAHDGTGAVAPGQLPWTVFDALLGSIPACKEWNQSWFRGVESAVELAMREEVQA